MLALNQLLSSIPKAHDLLQEAGLLGYLPHPLLTQAVRLSLDSLREDIKKGYVKTLGEMPSVPELLNKAAAIFEELKRPSLQRVINGTGVILHTNLGRAPLAQEALDAVQEIAVGYSNLEYKIDEGKRGSRYSHVEDLLKKLTGAEAAMAVNNNAAAVLLVLASIAPGKDVIVSRGELVEIGGSFRVPDVLLQSGCRLAEVGTTNKTYVSDYANAIVPGLTGAILRVHTSNFAVVGFVSKPSLKDLSKISNQNNIPLIEDLGSGCLVPLEQYGIYGQVTVSESVRSGADIITFSGDKLLGGPQAGIIVGRAEYISRIKSHPLARAMRIDKLSLAALLATLRLYLNPSEAVDKIPVLKMLCAPVGKLLDKANLLRNIIKDTCPKAEVTIVESDCRAGGGAMPEEKLSSAAIAVKMPGLSANSLEDKFRQGAVSVIGRIYKDQFLLDLRTISEDEFFMIAKKLAQ